MCKHRLSFSANSQKARGGGVSFQSLKLKSRQAQDTVVRYDARKRLVDG
jgi:hypothetical protein